MSLLVQLAEGLGLGRAPIAPGTLGSLLALPLHAFLAALVSWPAYAALILTTLPLHARICDAGRRAHDDPDPAVVVWDEVVGMLVALTALPPVGLPVALVFIAFRAFDILKPFPIGWLEAHIPGGWGILMDDVVAGLYAGLVGQIAFQLRPG